MSTNFKCRIIKKSKFITANYNRSVGQRVTFKTILQYSGTGEKNIRTMALAFGEKYKNTGILG